MSVVFDYTVRLENAYQILTGANPSWESEILTNPSEDVFFFSHIDPGHTGTTSVIDFNLEWLNTLDVTLAAEFPTTGGSFAGTVVGSVISTADTQAVAVGDFIKCSHVNAAGYVYKATAVVTNTSITVDTSGGLDDGNFQEIVPQTLAWKWDIKASGGSWLTVVSGTTTIPQEGGGLATIGKAIDLETGIYETATLMPAQVRLIGTDTDNSWSVIVGSASYTVAVRALGEV